MAKLKGSWLLGLAAGAGLALVMAAIMLSSSGPGSTPVANAQAPTATNTPPAPTATRTPTATPNQDCVLHVVKDAVDSTVPEGGSIDYTITIDNNGDNSSGECSDLTVTDVIPDDTDCASATVDSTSDITSSHWDITHCSSSGTVKWTTDSNLGTGNSAVLKLTLDLTSGASDGDTITNEACATSTDDEGGDCDSVDVDVTSATATPTTAPAATAGPTVVVPTVRPTTPPVIVVAPTISGPATGTGTSDSAGSRPLALSLGLLGGLLMLGSGVALVKKTR